jgi:hypothetical protein
MRREAFVLNELSWWRAMPIGVSCPLHVGLVIAKGPMRLASLAGLGMIGTCLWGPPAYAHAVILESVPRHEESVAADGHVTEGVMLFTVAAPEKPGKP